MEPLYVNPEALASLAHPYQAAGENYEHIAESYDELLPQFQEGIGRDKTGEAFYAHFIKGATELGLRVKNLRDAMAYCGEGLTQTSELYGQAEDDAEQSAQLLETEMDETLAPPVQPRKEGTATLARMYEKTVVEFSFRPVEENQQQQEQPARLSPAGKSVHPAEQAEQPALRRTAVRAVRPVTKLEPGIAPIPTTPVEAVDEGVLPLQPARMYERAMVVRNDADEPLQEPGFAYAPATAVVNGEMPLQEPGIAYEPATVVVAKRTEGVLPIAPPPDAVPGTPFVTVVVADSGPITRQDGVVVGDDPDPEVHVVMGVTPS